MDRGEPLPEHVTAYASGVLYSPGILLPKSSTED